MWAFCSSLGVGRSLSEGTLTVYRLSPSCLISLLLQLSKTACSACAVVLLVVVVLACRLLVVGGGLLVIVGVLVVGGGVVVVVWEGARVSVMICLP